MNNNYTVLENNLITTCPNYESIRIEPNFGNARDFLQLENQEERWCAIKVSTLRKDYSEQ